MEDESRCYWDGREETHPGDIHGFWPFASAIIAGILVACLLVYLT